MPFLATCLFCGQKIRAPDHAQGASLGCPRCGNFFTLVPEEGDRLPAKSAVFQDLLGLPKPKTSLPPLSDRPQAGMPPKAVHAKESVQQVEIQIVTEPESPQTASRGIDPAGAVGILLGGLAVLSGSLPQLNVVVVPLGFLALLAGIFGLCHARYARTGRLICPAAAAWLGLAVVLVALCWPHLLGPVYQAWKRSQAGAPTVSRVIPLPGKEAPEDGHWVDAGRAALREGGTRVHLTHVWIGPAQVRSAPEIAGTKKEYIFVSVKVVQAKAIGGRGLKKSRSGTGIHPELTDDQGTEYQLQNGVSPLAAGRPVLGDEEVFGFAGPPPGVKSLRIVFPAGSWGGSDPYRFSIPNTMIERGFGDQVDRAQEE